MPIKNGVLRHIHVIREPTSDRELCDLNHVALSPAQLSPPPQHTHGLQATLQCKRRTDLSDQETETAVTVLALKFMNSAEPANRQGFISLLECIDHRVIYLLKLKALYIRHLKSSEPLS